MVTESPLFRNKTLAKAFAIWYHPQITMRKFTNYLRHVRAEASQIVWPTREESTRYTALVIILSLTIGLYLSTVDTIFLRLLNLVLGTN